MWYSHTHDWTEKASLGDRGHSLPMDDIWVEQTVWLVSVTSREFNVLKLGRMEETKQEKWVVEERVHWRERVQWGNCEGLCRTALNKNEIRLLADL